MNPASCTAVTEPASAVFEYPTAPDTRAAAFVGPGVFTVGDLGRVDPDGWVYLEGRRTDLILSGGVNVYPAEVEAVLVEHPAVSDVAVFGVPDPEWGEAVHALVEIADGTEPDPALAEELIDYARARLAHYKQGDTLRVPKYLISQRSSGKDRSDSTSAERHRATPSVRP